VPDARQPLVVVVDDEQGTLDLLTDVFTDMDLRVLTTTDPEVGLDLIRQKRPQIVFLDLNMPKIGGMQLLEMVVNFDSAIEVFLFTGDYSTSSAVEAIQKGAADYLTKPISIADLRARSFRNRERVGGAGLASDVAGRAWSVRSL